MDRFFWWASLKRFRLSVSRRFCFSQAIRPGPTRRLHGWFIYVSHHQRADNPQSESHLGSFATSRSRAVAFCFSSRSHRTGQI